MRGFHITIDGYNCNKKSLGSYNTIYKLLNELPLKAGMKKISRPFLVEYEGKTKADFGISGFVLIAESHVSVHTYPLKGYVAFDLFSCKPFKKQDIVNYVKGTFEIKRLKVKMIKRGI